METGDAASEEETTNDDPIAPDKGRQADMRGDITESSDVDVDVDDNGDGDGDRIVTSHVPSAASNSDSAAYEDSELERDIPPPVSSSRDKSPVPGVVGLVGGGAHVVVDLSSSSEADSEGSSSVLASKPPPSSRRTKELEAARRKAQATPSG